MSAVIVAVAALLAAAVVGLRKVFVQALPEWLRIVRDVDDVTEIDRSTGAVRSVQSAEVVLPAERIDAMWSPEYLERLARTYWRFLSRATLRVTPAPRTGPGRAAGRSGPSRSRSR